MKNSKYAEIPNLVQVIGCVYKYPKLFEKDDKYKFNEQDFFDDFHQIVFGCIYNLWQLGAKEITLSAISDYLAQRPKALATFKANKGEEFILKAAEVANPLTFDYYYSRMKKMSLLRAYEDMGMNVSWIYDPDEIFDGKKKQEQEDWLDAASLEDIYNKINDKIDEIKLTYVDSVENSGVQIGEGIDELLASLAETPALGYPLYGDYINTVTRGARLGKFFLRSAATGLGKALPNDTIIPTPDGNKKVAEIQPGDYLFDAFGKPTKVLQIFPQGEKEVWEIVFKDGRKAKCSKDHLWSYCTEGQRSESKKNRIFSTNTLEEISKKTLYKRGHGYQILIPMQKAVEKEEKEFYLKPYTMGLLLGDGSFRYQDNQKALSYSSENEILPNFIAEEMNWSVVKTSDFNYNWLFKWKNNEKEHSNVWVEEALKDYPSLWNLKSDKKFIPKEYFEGSINQRRDLLNGLLDSDGSVDNKGRISYYTNSSQLRDDVLQLCFSLGLKANWIEDNHKETSTIYIIEIAGTPEDKVLLFNLPRKKAIIQDWYKSPERKENNLFNPIIEIKNLNYSTEMTCFLVDNEEHLFLMNDYIVTHNTRSMIADCCYIGCDQMYNVKTNRWEAIGAGQSCLFIATEQDLQECQTMCLSFIAGVDEEHILKSEYFVGEEERIHKAAQILKNSNIHFECLPDFTLTLIESVIKKHIREDQTQYCFFDYIHSSASILMEVGGNHGVKGLREDNVLFLMSSKLKDIAVQYGIFMMSSTQLNATYQESETPDQNLLRGSKAIADRIDWGGILLDVTKEDREKLASFCNKNNLPMPNLKLSCYKNRQGRWKGIYLWENADRSICHFNPIFATDWNYNIIEMENLKIKVEESTAF